MIDTMDIFTATMIAEGAEEPEGETDEEREESYLDACDLLLRTGVFQSLARSQGFWGRLGSDLLNAGLIGPGSEARARFEGEV